MSKCHFVSACNVFVASQLRPETSSRHRGQPPTGPLKLEEISTMFHTEISIEQLPPFHLQKNSPPKSKKHERVMITEESPNFTSLYMLQCCSVCYREPSCEISASTSASSKPMCYVCQQDCQSNNFQSWQDRCQVKLRSSLIEAMAERYMESPESPAFFTVGACSTNETATAPNLGIEAGANSASHPVLCARTI